MSTMKSQLNVELDHEAKIKESDFVKQIIRRIESLEHFQSNEYSEHKEQ